MTAAHATPAGLPLLALPRRPRWRSTLELRSSNDLLRWSGATTLVVPDRPWARDNPWGDAVSNPSLVLVDGSWRLYHSAGLDWRISRGRERIGRLVSA